jgi:hypothetical protein
MTLDNQLATQIQGLDKKSMEELRLFVTFLLQKQHRGKPKLDGSKPVSWDWEKFPEDLSSYAVQEKDMDALAKIFEDEPSAEELCKMLDA